MTSRRLVLLGLFGAVSHQAAAAQGRRVQLNIASDGDELLFKPDRLACPTGARVRLTLRHTGEIIHDPHNWVLLKPGFEAAFVADADRQAEDVSIPPGDEHMVLAATPLCPMGKTVSVEFTAPAPGSYTFVCSIPGHGGTMRGILTVTPS